MAARQARLRGDVRLDTGLAPWLLTGLICAVFCGVGLLLAWGEYPRRETVAGRLLPEGGFAQLRMDGAGRIDRFHVSERDPVAAGTPLFSVRRDVGLEDGEDALSQIVTQIRAERHQAERRLAFVGRQIKDQRRVLTARRDGLADELHALEAQLKAQLDRVTIAEARFAMVVSLVERGAVTQTEAMRTEDRHLSAIEAVASSRADLSRTRRALAEVGAELSALDTDAETQRAELKQALAAMDQRLTEAEQRRSRTVRAPFDGVVGAVFAHLGEDLDPSAPVMTLLPGNALLQAELLVPSRAAGFVAPGQAVRLRYDAFPHQKFGVAEGRIRSVSKTTFAPLQAAPGATSTEAVFRVIADLDAQSVSAYGAELPLQPGMTLSADLVLENRRLWAVLLDPIRAAAIR